MIIVLYNNSQPSTPNTYNQRLNLKNHGDRTCGFDEADGPGSVALEFFIISLGFAKYNTSTKRH
jgi:hypothetical protein